MSCHVIHLDFKKIHPENQRLLELKTEIEAKKTQQPSVKKADIETNVVSKVIEKTQNVHVQHIKGVKTYFSVWHQEKKFSIIFSRSCSVWLVVFVLFCLFVCLFYKRFTSKMNITCVLRLELHTLHKVIFWHVLNSVDILLFLHEDLTEFSKPRWTFFFVMLDNHRKELFTFI